MEGLEDINFDDEMEAAGEANISVGLNAGVSSGTPGQGDTTGTSLGFDRDAGQMWVYPTNYPVRDYQFNIVQQVCCIF